MDCANNHEFKTSSDIFLGTPASAGALGQILKLVYYISICRLFRTAKIGQKSKMSLSSAGHVPLLYPYFSQLSGALLELIPFCTLLLPQ